MQPNQESREDVPLEGSSFASEIASQTLQVGLMHLLMHYPFIRLEVTPYLPHFHSQTL